LNQAIALYQSAIERWRRLRDPYEEAVAQYGLGWSYHDLAVKAMIKLPSPVDRIRWTYDSSVELRQATAAFNRARRLFAAIGSFRAVATTYMALGWEPLYLGHYPEAKHFFHQADLAHRRTGNLFGQALAAYGEGWASAAAGDWARVLAMHSAQQCSHH